MLVELAEEVGYVSITGRKIQEDLEKLTELEK